MKLNIKNNFEDNSENDFENSIENIESIKSVKRFDEFLENKSEQVYTLDDLTFLFKENGKNKNRNIIEEIPHKFISKFQFKDGLYFLYLNTLKEVGGSNRIGLYDEKNKKLYIHANVEKMIYEFDIQKSCYYEKTFEELIEEISNKVHKLLKEYINNNKDGLKKKTTQRYKDIMCDPKNENKPYRLRIEKDILQTYVLDEKEYLQSIDYIREINNIEKFLEKYYIKIDLVLLYLLHKEDFTKEILGEYLETVVVENKYTGNKITNAERIGLEIWVNEYKLNKIENIEINIENLKNVENTKNTKNKENEYRRLKRQRDIVCSLKDTKGENVTITLVYKGKEVKFKYPKGQMMARNNTTDNKAPLRPFLELLIEDDDFGNIRKEVIKLNMNDKDCDNYMDYITKITYGRKVLYSTLQKNKK